MASDPSNSYIATHECKPIDVRDDVRDNVFIQYEGLYQQNHLAADRFVFLAFWGDPNSRTPDKLRGTFFLQANELASKPATLPNWQGLTVTDAAKGQNVCMGWYDPKTNVGGWCSVVVVANTGAGYPFGTDVIDNNGKRWEEQLAVSGMES